MSSPGQFGKRHTMQEFGSVCGATQEIRVNRLEERLQPAVPFPHRHDFYHLILVTSGSGWHEIDFRRYRVHSGQVFFMKPAQVHSWHLGPKTSGIVIEFGSELLFEFSRESTALSSISGLSDQFDLSKGQAVLKRSLFLIGEQMLEEYERQMPDFETSLRHFLVPLLLGLARIEIETNQGSARSRTSDDPVLTRFLHLVEEHFCDEHRVSFYSNRMKITAKALTMRVARALGKSARSVIQGRCLLETKRLLAYSKLSVAEIGFEVGFDDPNYFSRFFRNSTGSTPGEFRTRVRRVRD